VYALGVVLFQLLTGRHPFPMRGGAPRIAVKQMLADRADPPLLRPLNPAISPGVESIIRKCLTSDLSKRYQSAEELKEDIDRHLAHRPLRYAADPSFRERARKWVRRHPRLTSSGAVAAIAVAVLAVTAGSLLYARERARGLEARGRLADHQTAFRDAQSFLDDRTRSAARLDDGLEKLKEVLRGYGVPEDEESSDGWRSAATMSYLSDIDRERVRGDIGETFFLAAQVSLLKASATSDIDKRLAEIAAATKWNKLAERYGTERLPRALREQRGRLSELLGDKGEADRQRAEADRLPPVSARDFYLAGSQHARDGKHSDAIRQLQQATRLDPENFSAWFLRGVSHLALEQDDLAVMSFGACVSLRPDFSPAWRNRGFAFFRLRYFGYAGEDYDQAIRLDPTVVDALIQRGELREATGDLDGALADFTRALDTGEATARAYFKRATVKFLKGDHDGAKADREAGFKTPAADEMSWIARAENRLPDDPKAALADVDEALRPSNCTRSMCRRWPVAGCNSPALASGRRHSVTPPKRSAATPARRTSIRSAASMPCSYRRTIRSTRGRRSTCFGAD
jgi:tetratricopeptide (TPR) repeat protein